MHEGEPGKEVSPEMQEAIDAALELTEQPFQDFIDTQNKGREGSGKDLLLLLDSEVRAEFDAAIESFRQSYRTHIEAGRYQAAYDESISIYNDVLEISNKSEGEKSSDGNIITQEVDSVRNWLMAVQGEAYYLKSAQ